jgi:hypothetical protein
MIRPAVAAFSLRFLLRSGLLGAGLLGSGGACTKVIEQPTLAPPDNPPPEVKVAKKPTRPPSRNPWPPSTAFASDRTAPVARPAAAPDTRPAVETLNGDPNGLKREDLQKELDGAMPALAACFDGSEGSSNVALSFDADPAGKAANLKVSGGNPTSAGCVRGVLGGLRLPAFSGAAVPVHFPLTVRAPVRPKPAAAAQAATAPAAEPAAPPPLFVNP